MIKKLLCIVYFVTIVMLSKGQLLSVSIESDETGICEGDSIELRLVIKMIGTHELNVIWSPVENISSTSIDAPIVYPNRTTTYEATVTDQKTGQKMSTQKKISVVPRPVVKVPKEITACANAPVFLAPEKFDNSLFPTWKHNGNGHFENTSDSLKVTYIPAPNETGKIMFILTGHGIDYCRNVSDTTFIQYYEETVANITTNNQLLCSNDSLFINAVAENDTSFIWSHNGKGELINSNTLNPIYIPEIQEFGKIDIILEVQGLGCERNDTLSVNISQMYVNFENEIIACEGDRVYLTLTNSSSYSYLWNNGSIENEIMVTAIQDSTFEAEIVNTENCYQKATINLKVSELPKIYLEENILNKTIIVKPDGLEKYEFYDNKDQLLYEGQNNYFNYSGLNSDIKSLYIVAYNKFGCHSDLLDNHSDFYLIPFLKEVDAFSPNSDGINDRLLPGYKTVVIDRTHKILYEGTDGWDGTFNGTKLPQGTYFYLVYEDGEIFYKGPVTLLR